MRNITRHSTYTYTTKASAMRAVRNLVGNTFTVNTPELENRFSGRITVAAEMIGVEPHGEGWRWLYVFDLADVMVEIFRKPLGEGGVPETVRYAEVANWQDARTPSIEEVVPPQTLEQLDCRVKAYMCKVDGPSDGRFHDERWELRALCRRAGTTLEAMLWRLGFFDVDPTAPTPTTAPVVPDTLNTLTDDKLAELRNEMRAGLAYKFFHTGAYSYQIGAVIEPTEPAHGGNLHYLSGTYETRAEVRAVLAALATTPQHTVA